MKETERKPSAPLAGQFLCQMFFSPGSSLKASVHFYNTLVRARLSPQEFHPFIWCLWTRPSGGLGSAEGRLDLMSWRAFPA